MRGILSTATAAAMALMAVMAPAGAQTWPSKPVKLIVPFPAGGSADTLSRIISQELQDKLGQPFVVENRTGAGGNIGTDAVAKAAPDGATLLLTPSSLAIAPALYPKLTWDPVKDFEPITLIGSIPMVVVVHPAFPAKSMMELVAQAKARPGQINYASGGNGTTNHLAVELFKAQTGIDMIHVAYRGNPLAMVDVMGGHVPVFFDFVLTGAPHVRSGAVRAPTVIEAGIPGFEASTWFGVYAPAGTPKDMVAHMNDAIAAVLALPNVKKRLAELGVEPMQGGPAALAEITRSDLAKWGPVIQKAGLKLE